jgi:hypothetical protein
LIAAERLAADVAVARGAFELLGGGGIAARV